MSSLTSGVGIFSGLDTQSIIDRLIAIDSRPKQLVQKRVIQLQGQQAAYLDLNSRLQALKSAATKFGSAKIFQTTTATSSDASVLTATGQLSAPAGTYALLVDRLASSQQFRTRGFADRDVSGIGATSVTIESAAARLDSDTTLASLNGGAGVSRGTIQITDRSGATATVDLSRAVTVGDVLDAISKASGVRVQARVSGDRLVLEDKTGLGTGTLSVSDGAGYATATSLGLAGSSGSGTITGAKINTLGASSTLRSLNDGNGVAFNNTAGTSSPDFVITAKNGTAFNIDVGDVYEMIDGKLTKTKAAATDLGTVLDRINAQTGGAITAGVAADGVSVQLLDNTGGSGAITVTEVGSGRTARDLGIVGTSSGDRISGKRILASLNSSLARSLGGGSGLTDGSFSITARDGSAFSFSVTTDGSVSEVLDQIAAATGGKVKASLDQTGTGLVLSDSTGGTGNFIVSGAGATALGVATAGGGTASSTVTGTRLQKQYVGVTTLLSSLNGGKGVGTGALSITDSTGQKRSIQINNNDKTVGDVLAKLNAAGLAIDARINDKGDGILISEKAGTNGATKITIADSGGSVAKALNLAGSAGGTGASNKLDGSYEKTVTLSAADTLDAAVAKINAAGGGISASVIRESTGATPFRLVLSSTATGSAGRYTVSFAGADLGVTTTNAGNDSRVFYGSDDPAQAILLTGSSNTLENAVSGVTVTLKAPSSKPVTLTVARDTTAMESAITDFVASYNAVATRIGSLTEFKQDSNKRGALLGDSMTQQLESAMISAVSSRARGVSGAAQSLDQVGITFQGDGTLKFDAEQFRRALDADPENVENLFAAKVVKPKSDIVLSDGVTVKDTGPDQFSSLGVAEIVGQLVDRYTNSVDGLLTLRNQNIDTQVRAQNDRITVMDKRLNAKRDLLQRQFLAMEQAIGKLQGQQSALGSIGSVR